MDFKKGDRVTIEVYANEGSDYSPYDYFFDNGEDYTVISKSFVEVISAAQVFQPGLYAADGDLYEYRGDDVWTHISLFDGRRFSREPDQVPMTELTKVGNL